MKKLVLLIMGLVFLSGCIPVLVGAGVAAGYGLSNDSAYGNIKSEYRILWDICLDKLDSMEAEILTVNESKGIIKAKVSETNLTIKINSINTKLQKLKVTARRLFLPKAQFAQKIFFKLIEDLKS